MKKIHEIREFYCYSVQIPHPWCVKSFQVKRKKKNAHINGLNIRFDTIKETLITFVFVLFSILMKPIDDKLLALIPFVPICNWFSSFHHFLLDSSCSFILITWQAVQNCVTWKWRKSFSFSLKLPILYSKHETLVSFMLANTVFISCLGYSNFSAMIYSCFSTIFSILAIKRCRNNLILLCMYVPNKYSEAN